MIIGLTPFLYLHSTAKTGDLQDGICDEIVLGILFKQEKSAFFGKYMLTAILRHAMIVMLGRFHSPSCFYLRGTFHSAAL